MLSFSLISSHMYSSSVLDKLEGPETQLGMVL